MGEEVAPNRVASHALTVSSVVCGIASPLAWKYSNPASARTNSRPRFRAVSTRCAAGMTSLPTPSPGMIQILFPTLDLGHGQMFGAEFFAEHGNQPACLDNIDERRREGR